MNDEWEPDPLPPLEHMFQYANVSLECIRVNHSGFKSDRELIKEAELEDGLAYPVMRVNYCPACGKFTTNGNRPVLFSCPAVRAAVEEMTGVPVPTDTPDVVPPKKEKGLTPEQASSLFTTTPALLRSYTANANKLVTINLDDVKAFGRPGTGKVNPVTGEQDC